VILIGALVSFSGCKSSPPIAVTPPAAGVSFSKDIQPIFTTSCVICHQGTGGPSGLSLEPSSAYKNLINVKSAESSLARVAPVAPDKSYLLNKLMGTQGQVGGSGGQMPFNAPALPQDKLDLIKKWIADGAPDN